jgi:putative transposase
MRLMQSVFSIRFNKFRKEKGHIFQGRFKSIVIEDRERLGWLCHYIHLNPVRAGICGVEGLRFLEFSSYHHLWNKRKRPSFMSLESCLESAGELKDTPAGRRKYAEYLSWLVEDEPRQKAMLFDKMSKGWAMGTKRFKAALLEDEKSLKACMKLGVSEAKEMREVVWDTKLEVCLAALNIDISDCAAFKKSESWKIAVAGYMKQQQLCRNGWLSDRLSMGNEYAVSRYVSEMFSGQRMEAKKLYDTIITKVKD